MMTRLEGAIVDLHEAEYLIVRYGGASRIVKLDAGEMGVFVALERAMNIAQSEQSAKSEGAQRGVVTKRMSKAAGK